MNKKSFKTILKEIEEAEYKITEEELILFKVDFRKGNNTLAIKNM